jgi:hypothetical protein
MAGELTRNSGSRGGAEVVWLGYHTAEGGYDSDPADAGIDAGSADSLVDFFVRSIGTSDPKSSHAIADDDEIRDDLVPYDRKAFTLRNGNPKSDNLEMMALAKWSRAEWLQHDGLLWNAALWGARRAKARGWSLSDVRHLTVAQVKAGNVRGFIGHVDYTEATDDGTHWDPGPNFPWDVVISRARDIFSGTTDNQEDDMTPEQANEAHVTYTRIGHVDTMLSQNLSKLLSASGTAADNSTAILATLKSIDANLTALNEKLTPPVPPTQ